jgi:hypothetical protein
MSNKPFVAVQYSSNGAPNTKKYANHYLYVTDAATHQVWSALPIGSGVIGLWAHILAQE